MSNKRPGRVRAWFATADFSEGTRVPPERGVGAMPGLSRADLRNALLVLEAERRLGPSDAVLTSHSHSLREHCSIVSALGQSDARASSLYN